MTKLAVIGCGNMGSAIVRGLVSSGWCNAEDIIVSHPNEEHADALTDELGVPSTTSNRIAAEKADILLMGVKPQIIHQALHDLSGVLKKSQVIISIAAGISTRVIESYTGQLAVVRSMPNLGVVVGLGATAITGGSHATREHIELARQIFESVGSVEEVPENQLDAVTGLSGTGPLYVFHFLEAMADAGVHAGLSREVATRLSLQTIKGSIEVAEQSDDHPASLRDKVTSPGGTAIAALHTLRKEAFSAIIMDAVAVATRRSRELGS